MNLSLGHKVFFVLLTIITILTILNIWSFMALDNYNNQQTGLFFKKTNFNTEKNIPSIFSGSLHFIAAIILAAIGLSKLRIENKKVFWFCLSFLFLFVGLDEILRIHEKLNRYLSNSWETSGIFYYTWVIPYGVALILIALVCFKSIFALPKQTIRDFILSAFIFLSGALGMEMFTGWYISFQNLEGLYIEKMNSIFVLYTVEELLEMLGISYFIYSLLRFISQYRAIQQPIFNIIIFKDTHERITKCYRKGMGKP
ncbi:hypothetical protein [Christiangramia sp. LLG6405-1]|uniref:hypothetical protein n=1 Tax=Christiangramia sp. LLG6405-1 TaxID=3160832 RepID=UPI003865AD99